MTRDKTEGLGVSKMVVHFATIVIILTAPLMLKKLSQVTGLVTQNPKKKKVHDRVNHKF